MIFSKFSSKTNVYRPGQPNWHSYCYKRVIKLGWPGLYRINSLKPLNLGKQNLGLRTSVINHYINRLKVPSSLLIFHDLLVYTFYCFFLSYICKRLSINWMELFRSSDRRLRITADLNLKVFRTNSCEALFTNANTLSIFPKKKQIKNQDRVSPKKFLWLDKY